jgi:Protein of unknown function (DUF3293)
MDELIAAYQATDYRVRLARGGWVSIRIDKPLPLDLLPLVGDNDWGFITAWNPQSQPAPRQSNRHAQHMLLAALRGYPSTVAVRAAIGVGGDGQWREPSLFVVGPDSDQLDPLARRFGQNAYLHGYGAGPAMLRWLWERL